jgi:transcriptional regulator with XRE-family HTH domain
VKTTKQKKKAGARKKSARVKGKLKMRKPKARKLKVRKLARKRRAAPETGTTADARVVDGTPKHMMGYTLSDIDRGIGVTLGFVSRLLRGKREPSVGTLQKLAAFLGRDLGEVADLFAPGSAEKARMEVEEIARAAGKLDVEQVMSMREEQKGEADDIGEVRESA